MNPLGTPTLQAGSSLRDGWRGFAGAPGWALLYLLENQTLNPFRRQPLAHDPRINGSLGATDHSHDLRHSNTAALLNKAHGRKEKKNCTMCKKRLALRCTLCSVFHMNSITQYRVTFTYLTNFAGSIRRVKGSTRWYESRDQAEKSQWMAEDGATIESREYLAA